MAEQAKPVALVTGAARKRVGQTIVKYLAGRGFRVAAHYYASGAAADALRADLIALRCEHVLLKADVRDETQVKRMITETRAAFGRIDLLVTAAATWESCKFDELDSAAVNRSLEVNTLGTLLCCKHAADVMLAQHAGGCIVTIGDWAIERPYTDHLPYLVSKGAIPVMTRALAVELAAKNPRIRVNCILPGPVMLPDDIPPTERARIVASTLVKREGSPENIAHAVMFFYENDFVTGVSLPVDGGRTVAYPS